MAKLNGTAVQLAAIPYRIVNDRLEVLLVTSRETKRWLVPKGWPIPGKKDHKAAAQEAREEAGVEGKIRKKPVGSYGARKRLPDRSLMVLVTVYVLPVENELADWKEQGQRERIWLPAEAAAALVDEPGLSSIIAELGAIAGLDRAQAA